MHLMMEITNTPFIAEGKTENLKLLMDGKNPLASAGGILFDTIPATSNEKYAPKVLYATPASAVTTMKPNTYNPYSNYYNHSGYGTYQGVYGGTYTWRKEKLSDAGLARSEAKEKLRMDGHKVKFFSSKKHGNHLMLGVCKHCHRSAYLMFIPFAGEYVMEGDAFENHCISVKKNIDTVSSTPTKGNFDIDLTNYPFGIVREGGQDDIWQ
jgi:hypothetical protein